jgi:hypothetical protein
MEELVITTRKKVAKADKTYVCDILYKEIKAEDVLYTFNNILVASREAVERLPEAFRSEEMVGRLMFAIGSYDSGFMPEMLHTGVWVFTGSQLVTSDKRTDVRFGLKQPKLDTVAEAMAHIAARYKDHDLFDFEVFENGVLVRRTTPDVRVMELNLT